MRDVIHTANHVAPVAGAVGWLLGFLPSVAAIASGVWATILIIDFIAKGKYKEWFK